MSVVRQAKYSKYEDFVCYFFVLFCLLLGRVIKSSYINNKFFNKSLLIVVFLFKTEPVCMLYA